MSLRGLKGLPGLLVMVVLAATALAGCATRDVEPDGPAEPSESAAYECGGIHLTDDALAARIPIDDLPASARQALADATWDDGLPLDLGDRSAWFVVSHTDEAVTLLRESEAPDAAADHEQLVVSWVDAPNFGPGWLVTSMGPCPLTIDLGDLTVPDVALDPAHPVDPRSRELQLLVTERDCNSGEDADGRVEIVRLDEDEDRVSLVLGVRPRGGGQTCPSNPGTPFTVTLTDPIGDRVIVDAAAVGGRPLTDPDRP